MTNFKNTIWLHKMKARVWKPTNPKFQLILTHPWKSVEIILVMFLDGLGQNIKIFIFAVFRRFLFNACSHFFSGVSQKIENSSLYRTVYKDIFYVPSRIGEPKYIEWWPSEKLDFCGSILTERVSKIVGSIFLTADSERAWKTALDATCSILITHWFDV